MLDIHFEDNATVSILSREDRIICDLCDQETFIFQDEGNFCLNCWQDRTEPHITQGRICKEGDMFWHGL